MTVAQEDDGKMRSCGFNVDVVRGCERAERDRKSDLGSEGVGVRQGKGERYGVVKPKWAKRRRR